MYNYKLKDWNNNPATMCDLADLFHDMRIELALREGNKYYGSGLGGNYSEFLFVLSNNFRLMPESDSDRASFIKNGEEIIVKMPKDLSMQGLREALSIYMKENSLPQLTLEQVLDVSYLRSLNSKSSEVNLLIQAIEKTNKIVPYLDSRRELSGEKRILSQEIVDEIATVLSYPEHIALFATRSLIQLDRMIVLNLDKYESISKGFERINKILSKGEELSTSSNEGADEK